MFAAQLTRCTLSRLSALGRPALIVAAPKGATLQCMAIRSFTKQARPSSLRKLKSPTLKERLMAPAGDTSFTLGRGLVAGASVIGLGALCFYGLGLSDEVGAIDRASLWPEVVRERIHTTYMYFGSSLVFTAGTAVAISRNRTMMNLMMRNSWMSIIVTMGAMIGSGMVARSIPYQEGFGAKQLAWMVHSGVVGAVIAPITLMGGPILIRAACYTAGIVGGLSTLAMCAPSEKFLNMGGPLAMGLGVVIISSLGSAFLPPTTVMGAGLYSISIYGGLVLFGMFLLYDTQKIINRAETHPTYSHTPFDPINSSISIYLDTINIFIRIAAIMSGGGNRRR